MIAFTLEWHKECLKNRLKGLEEKRRILERQQREIAREEKEIEFYTLQIQTAEQKKKKSFDTDRFMKSEKAAFFAT